jgi:hypothetical protein
MELAERITGRVTELTSEVELLRKQLADAEHELERLVIAGQVITQLTAGDAPAGGEPAAGAGAAGFRVAGAAAEPGGRPGRPPR